MFRAVVAETRGHDLPVIHQPGVWSWDRLDLGRLPDLPAVCLTVGLGGRGLSWAFVVADQLTDLMLHDADPALLSVARLG